ncbi:hypothetical protein BJ508DRAFT_360053 [Ascobolus immersus RN42]|uniref:Uncharacterized protein n=1 Tax=Ascobolus immersus RN42 TaxID=1160509 RepID=A0A3N4IH94_ASCIM|nr:hypothetical protein BJ508DRAFT_360053 [Ascobolus immersus RN42]
MPLKNIGIYRSYPATLEQYPWIRKDLHDWSHHLLLRTFRLRTSTGPATLPELLSPGPETKFYIEILWEHPPDAWWARRRMRKRTQKYTSIYHSGPLPWIERLPTPRPRDDYYVKLMKKLWDRTPPPQTECTQHTHGERHCCHRRREDAAVEFLPGWTLFDLLRAVEVDRVVREEYAEQEQDIIDTAIRKGKAEKDVRIEKLPKGFRLEEPWRRRFERCYYLETELSKILGITPIPQAGYLNWGRLNK